MRSYTLDATDMIVAIDGDWQSFWENNGGQGDVATRVLGQVLWEAIADPETTAYLGGIIHKVHRTQLTVTQQYRCDSPWAERVFSMSLMPIAKNRILVGHDLIRSRPHPIGLLKEMPHLTYRQCSQCMSCNFGGPWVPHIRVNVQVNAVAIEAVCPSCRAGIIAAEVPTWDEYPPLCA